MKNRLKLFSIWDFELWDKKDGQVLKRWTERNICPDAFLNDALDVLFDGGTQKTTWYMLLFEDNHTPAAGDTYATPGFTECTAYDESDRVTVNFAEPSSKSITNSANPAQFTISDTKTIYGAGLVAGGSAPQTKSNTAGGGILGPVSQFSGGSESVVDDNVLTVTVTITIADT